MDKKDSARLPQHGGMEGPPLVAWRQRRVRRSRAIKATILACLVFITYAQWQQLSSSRSSSVPASPLSASRLQADYATCSKLRQKPKNPVGPGRSKSERYVVGQRPVLIRNATVWTGEAVSCTSQEDVRKAKCYSWVKQDVLLMHGLIKVVAKDIQLSILPPETIVFEAHGRPLTSGIIDMHSHAGVDTLPNLVGNSDDNEVSSPTTPYVRSIDAINPLDPQIQVIKSGGVTTSLILPGSGNSIGGEAYLLKHAVGKAQGRPELSIASMLADPARTWRYMKMACGENPKRVYGKIGRGPVSRMGEAWEFRRAFAAAADLVREQDDWCDAAAASGPQAMITYLPVDLERESLAAVLRGHVHVNTHCYTATDLESFVSHTNEFNFSVRAFHHAHQTFLVPEVLKRAWGETPPAAALFADNMYYKAEAYIGSEYAGRDLWEAGITPIYVSDNPVLNAQHVLREAAMAYHWGLPYHVALASVTSAPAERLGMGERLGKVRVGFDGDVVIWDSDPLSLGAAPVQVWIDGVAQFEDPVELEKKSATVMEPDVSLAAKFEETAFEGDVVFINLHQVLLDDRVETSQGEGLLNAVIRNGIIHCLGFCEKDVADAINSGSKRVELKNGYLTHALTVFGSTFGMSEIDAEKDTQNGWGNLFSRAVDGLALDTKKLHEAVKYGVTRAISAPYIHSLMSHHGTSVGFLTGAKSALDKGAVFSADAAVHYTLTHDAAQSNLLSISSHLGAFRHMLLTAAEGIQTIADQYSEAAYLQKVIKGEMTLAITVNSADVIAGILGVKAAVEERLKALSNASTAPKLNMVIIGAGEAHLLAKELAAADVGVVLAPFQSFALEWDTRRSLPGTPLTNATAVDVLVDAGVTVAIGLEEDSVFRHLNLLAGVAYANGQGRFSEKSAMDLVSSNVYKMLGMEQPKGHFIVSEGSPLEIGSRIRGVGAGLGYTTVFD